jgi:hypothetical protein
VYKKNLQELFDKPMTRNEFLTHIGMAFLVLIGVKGLLDHLGGTSSGSQVNQSSSAYGSSRYGE